MANVKTHAKFTGVGVNSLGWRITLPVPNSSNGQHPVHTRRTTFLQLLMFNVASRLLNLNKERTLSPAVRGENQINYSYPDGRSREASMRWNLRCQQHKRRLAAVRTVRCKHQSR